MFTSRNTFYFSLLFFLISTHAVNTVEAGIEIAFLIKRCEEDVLISQQEALGRNAWGRKCHYISEEEEAYSNRGQLYLTFTQGSIGGEPHIPVDESQTCIDGLEVGGFCSLEAVSHLTRPAPHPARNGISIEEVRTAIRQGDMHKLHIYLQTEDRRQEAEEHLLLHTAVSSLNTQACQALLAKGVDANYLDATGFPAFHSALMNDDERLMLSFHHVARAAIKDENLVTRRGRQAFLTTWQIAPRQNLQVHCKVRFCFEGVSQEYGQIIPALRTHGAAMPISRRMVGGEQRTRS